MVAAKPEVAAPVHEDYIEPVEPVTSWTDDAPPAAATAATAAAATTFGAAPAQQDWAAQVCIINFIVRLVSCLRWFILRKSQHFSLEVT